MDGSIMPSESSVPDALAIAELAGLSQIEYDRVRDATAARLGIRVSTLDAEVKKACAVLSNHEDHQPPAFTDEALALQFSAQYAHTLRYVAAWGKWYQWTGKAWEADQTIQTYDRARTICREASAMCNDTNIAIGIAKAQTVAAVERLARADRRHAATVEQWDADHWLLNTPGGVVDLRVGRMRAHRPDDHMTKVTAVAPGGVCPMWEAFLQKITNNDEELQKFLQRVAGYSLTGSTREHALFFGYGTGGNGKGVYLNTITGIMGGYATVASIDTFTASSTDRHPTDLAMLRGARLVTAQETEEGRKWAESRIKAMTGGDPITARFMRQDFFTFLPAFKLFIAGNHKPGLRNVDDAIRRRFNLIPFAAKIAAGERDPELPEKLKEEWPGILKWAIAGCLDWQANGLNPPSCVTAATNEYFEAEDAFGQWFAECCVETKSVVTASSTLFKSWTTWAEQAGEHAGSQKRFSQSLIARGFEATRIDNGPDKGKAAFKGITAAIVVNQPRSSNYYNDDPGPSE
ncbi:phage/plasmid primase, P4 family [Acidocella sp.]|jgi:putative DNA primase/helicase|uniref:phage/plasmid primase, P4 family n=1 Tax=Acidocella sp. TaxID=50710 RepID=UPI002F4070E1